MSSDFVGMCLETDLESDFLRDFFFEEVDFDDGFLIDDGNFEDTDFGDTFLTEPGLSDDFLSGNDETEEVLSMTSDCVDMGLETDLEDAFLLNFFFEDAFLLNFCFDGGFLTDVEIFEDPEFVDTFLTESGLSMTPDCVGIGLETDLETDFLRDFFFEEVDFDDGFLIDDGNFE
eukprot:872573_1